MKLRVKRDMTAYVHDRRYRSGQVVDVSEKALRKVDKAYLDALEVQRAKELGAGEAKKHGLKVGDFVLPKWADPVSKPVGPEPGVPGSGKQPGSQEPEEGDGEGEGEKGSDEDAQKVL